LTLLGGGPPADNSAVEAAKNPRQPLGELLLAKGLVAKEELELALEEQAETGRLLGAILVDRGCVSGPALAVALAEQNGVELHTEEGFGTGLWAKIERRHRSEQGAEDRAENVVRIEPAPPPLEAVPDPDPQLEQLEAENRRLQDEIERLKGELTRPKLVEAPEEPSSHLLFVPRASGYLLVERQGSPPEPGDDVALAEGSFVVSKLGRAPVPGERRVCAFLLAR
jgi:hypothetical protein